MQLLTAEEIAFTWLARWVIYGDNGRGKTTLVSTIPPHIPTLVVSFDQENTRPLVGKPHIKIMKVNHWDEIGQILELFRARTTLGDNNFTPNPDFLSGKKPFFKALVFDTWSRAQGLAANKLIGYDPFAPGQDFKKFLREAPKNPKGWEAWQQIGALATEWMRYFMYLPVHTIFLAQEMEYEKRFGSKTYRIGPAFTPSALVRVKEICHLLGRLWVSTGGGEINLAVSDEDRYAINPAAQERRYLLLGSHDGYDSKGPTDILGYCPENPTWELLARSLTATPSAPNGATTLTQALPA